MQTTRWCANDKSAGDHLSLISDSKNMTTMEPGWSGGYKEVEICFQLNNQHVFLLTKETEELISIDRSDPGQYCLLVGTEKAKASRGH